MIIKKPTDEQLSAWLDGSEVWWHGVVLRPVRKGEYNNKRIGSEFLLEPLTKQGIFWPDDWPEIP